MNNNPKMIPLNIQLFAEGEGTTPSVADGTGATTQNTVVQPQTVDYDKIQGMIDSRNQRNEDAILKSYYQKQGLSEDEMNSAIQAFKAQKEASSKKQIVDNQNLQSQLNKANADLLKEKIEKVALIQANELGVDIKNMPYLTKLADFSNITDDKGEISEEKVKEALNKVLTDIPGLKKQEEPGTKGVQVGADASNSAQPSGNQFGFNFTGVRKH